jgi:predicted GIY-YIG superfamily endonuclease
MKQPAVYMLANRKNGTLYTGVTSNLVARVWQHRNATIPGFSKTYACKLLVWFELHDTMASAIVREKQIKGGSRAAKGILIAASNPDWLDLYDTLF